MTYLCFQLKHLLKSRLTYVPLLLIVAASLVTLFLNAKASQNNNLGVQISESLQQTQKAVADEKERLKTLSKDSAEYPYVQKNISEEEATIKSDRAFLAAYQKGDWENVYQKQIAYLEKVRQTAEDNTIDATMKSVLNRDLLMYQALAKENFAYEDPYFPTQALPFVLSLTNYLFPTLLPIALIFILSNLYTSAFASKTIDKIRLLPESAWCLAIKDIAVGFVVSLALLILSVLPVFLVAALFFGVGEWDYPILHYHLSDKTLYFLAIKDSVLLVFYCKCCRYL